MLSSVWLYETVNTEQPTKEKRAPANLTSNTGKVFKCNFTLREHKRITNFQHDRRKKMYFCVFSLGFKLDFSPKSGIKYISSAIEQEQQFFCCVCIRKAYERAIEGVCIHFKCGYAEYSNRKERENNFTVFQLEFKRMQTKMMVN